MPRFRLFDALLRWKSPVQGTTAPAPGTAEPHKMFTSTIDDIDDMSFAGSISMFGDSLTGYSFHVPGGPGLVLSDLCKNADSSMERKIHVLDYGFAGQTSRSLKEHFKRHVVDAYSTKFPGNPPLLVTIWLGANDAVLFPSFAHVPISEFGENIKWYVETIGRQPGWRHTRVLLMTPPPISVSVNRGGVDVSGVDIGSDGEDALSRLREVAKEGLGYRTWVSKRAYAERVTQVAQECRAEKIGVDVVDCLDVWTLMIEAALREAGREWEEDKLPGCGLPGAVRFPQGWFTDGLHFGSKGYRIITEALMEKCKLLFLSQMESTVFSGAPNRSLAERENAMAALIDKFYETKMSPRP